MAFFFFLGNYVATVYLNFCSEYKFFLLSKEFIYRFVLSVTDRFEILRIFVDSMDKFKYLESVYSPLAYK